VGRHHLKEAKEKRDEHRKLVRQGGDPVEAKRHKRAADATFASVAADYIAAHARIFRNPKSAKSIQTLLLTHASVLGPQPINQIGSAHIVNTLRPLWLSATKLGGPAPRAFACFATLRPRAPLQQTWPKCVKTCKARPRA
jgi:hypothetical protein